MPRRIYVLLWAVSLFTLSVAAESVTFPGYMDSAYYYHVAANLATGRGLVEDFVWNYLQGTPDLPAPSNLYWMPLTSFVAAPAMALLGPSFRSAQLSFVLLGSLVPLMTFWLAWYLLRNGRDALLAAFLTLFSGFYFGYWVAVDSFALFLLLVTPALVLMDRVRGPAAQPGRIGPGVLLPSSPSRNGRTPHTHALPVGQALASFFRAPLRAALSPQPERIGLQQAPPQVALGHVSGAMPLAWLIGVLIAGAHLARADGALLLVVFLLLLAPVQPRRWALTLGAVVLLSYLAVMTPWFLRGAGVSETPLAALALRAALLQEYDQLFALTAQPTAAGFLAQGPTAIIATRLAALGSNLLDFFGGVYFLAPVAALGLWEARRRREWRPFLLYASLLYLIMSLVFSFPGARGSFRHSAAALLPWLAVASVVGLRRAVTWAAARLPHWEVERAVQGFGLVLTAGAATLALITFNGHLRTWGRSYENYVVLARWLGQQPAVDGPIMVTNPPLFTYVTRRPAVVTPSDGVDSVLMLADRYGVQLLALEFDHARQLDPLYRGEARHVRLEPAGTAGRTRLFTILPPQDP